MQADLEKPEFIELLDWMKTNRYSLRSFAEFAGVDRSTLWRVVNGTMVSLSLEMVSKVAHATRGQIGERAFARHVQRVITSQRYRRLIDERATQKKESA